MRSMFLGLALTLVSTAAGAEPVTSAEAGKTVYGANGKRIGAAYRVLSSGAVQVIIDGKMVTIPASSVSLNNGKIETTMSKRDLVASR